MENQPYNAPNPQSTTLSQSDERMWAMLCHLSALAGFIIPFGNIVGPVVIWQIYKDKSAFIDFHGKESVNFQITMTIFYAVGILLTIILIGIVVLIALGVVSLVFFIIAALKANNGEYYRYPLTIRFVK